MRKLVALVTFAVCLTVVLFAQPTPDFRGSARLGLPQSLSNEEFWRFPGALSEPAGSFGSDNLLSNEILFASSVPGLDGPSQKSAPASDTGLLMGSVVDPITDRPVAGALITLGGGMTPSGANWRVIADAQGRFVFTDLPQGTYAISVSKQGYSDGAYGRLRPGGLAQALPLAADERIGDLRIPIWKNAAITGTVADESGEPMVDVTVRALLRTRAAGKPVLVPVPVSTVRTDDQGFYRIPSLVPGEYVVVVPSTQTSAPESIVDLYRQEQARTSGAPSDVMRDLAASRVGTALDLIVRSGGFSVDGLTFQSSTNQSRSSVTLAPSSDGRIFVYPTQFYAAAMTPVQASSITLRSGEERLGVDFQLSFVPTARVSGTVTGPDGPLAIGLSLALTSAETPAGTGTEAATTWSDATGRFTFLGVPAGQYLLRAAKVPERTRGASSSDPVRSLLWATLPVSVGPSDIRDVAITLRTGFRIAGGLEFDSAGSRTPSADEVRRLLATVELTDGAPMDMPSLRSVAFDVNGRFSSRELPPGRYYLRLNNPPPGWTVKSTMWNGRDVANLPLSLDRDVNGVVLTLTDRPGELNGWVQGPSGAHDGKSTVLVFPAESASWVDYGNSPPRLRSIRAGRDGAYRVVGLPAGDYLVVAVPDDAAHDWQDPATLQTLARVATRVELIDGGTRSLTLKTVVVRR